MNTAFDVRSVANTKIQDYLDAKASPNPKKRNVLVSYKYPKHIDT